MAQKLNTYARRFCAGKIILLTLDNVKKQNLMKYPCRKDDTNTKGREAACIPKDIKSHIM